MIVPEFFVRFGDLLIGREHGPLPFRFVLQPLVAVVLAGPPRPRDAREGLQPYSFRAVFTDKARRPELLRLAWKDVGRVFIVAFAFIPSLLVRGPATRIARRFHQQRKDSMTNPG